jgi:hypothetical protein
VSIGGSLFLVAVGAILKWAVTATVSWLNLQTVGTILFAVGLAGLAVSLFYTFWVSQPRTPPVEEDSRPPVMPPAERVPPPGRSPRF